MMDINATAYIKASTANFYQLLKLTLNLITRSR
jgi:hypothetical protein